MKKEKKVGHRDRDIRDTVRYRRLAGSEGFQTVKPEAAQEATSKREKAKELRRRADSDPRFSRVWGKRAAQNAARLDRESKEALKNLERPRTVTANVPKRATGPSEMKQVAKVAAGSVDSKP